MKNSNKLFFIPILAVLFLAAILIVLILFIDSTNKNYWVTDNNFGTFSSCRDLSQYINNNYINNSYPVDYLNSIGSRGETILSAPEAVLNSENISFSETNIQVQGVDEADIVKTNGKSLFVLKDAELIIFNIVDKLNPIELSRIEVSANPIEMFLFNDKVIVFGHDSFTVSNSSLENSRTDLLVVDIADLANPRISEQIRLQGNYSTSRMLDNTVYLISNLAFSNIEKINEGSVERYIPQINERFEQKYFKAADCNEISYFGSSVNSFVTILAFDVENNDYNTKVLLGDSSNTYMSKNNLFLSSVAFEYSSDQENTKGLFSIEEPDHREIISTNTDIFKIALDGLNINFASKGRVSGTVLNQFSMSEKDNYFRVATTVNDWNGWGPESENILYVLNEDLEEVSKVDGLGIDEKIYSVRYLEDRAYLVTFRQVDPLYVIDLSDPENPEKLGELKIPGFSSYLHPFDLRIT